MKKIQRRTMLKTMGGISAGTVLPLYIPSSEVLKGSSNTKNIRTDILVIGGGTAGVIAAIQAARAGCSTILTEAGYQLGGTQ
jgi:NADPH-dependent 2,4-dienoyl-CoA reductase/sulfur reductase-like enzyme